MNDYVQWVKRAEVAERALAVAEKHVVRADRLETAIRDALEILTHSNTFGVGKAKAVADLLLDALPHIECSADGTMES